MIWGDPLHREFERLERLRDTHARGAMFEALVQRLCEREHFRVTRDAGTARPRQTDLLASYGGDDFLIETKWQKVRADVADVDSLRSRLSRTATHVVGVLASMAGFTATAIEEVAGHRERIILLVDGPEIRDLFRNRSSLLALLRRKRERLIADGRVVFGEEGPHRSGPVPNRSSLPSSDLRIATAGGDVAPWVAGAGNFAPMVFVQELPDVEWITGHGPGIGLDLQIDGGTRADIGHVLEALRGMGWVSSAGRFAIQQAATCWHGAGAAAFLDALDAWESRYRAAGTRMHHTEEATYFDKWADGFYTLSMRVEPDHDHVWGVDFSMRLPGIPLVVEPIRALAHALIPEGHPYFRPLETGVLSRPLNLAPRSIALEVVAPLLSTDTDEDWVVGIVARNPFHGPLAPPIGDGEDIEGRDWGGIRDVEFLICQLGSWHQANHPVGGYSLHRLSVGQTSDAMLVEVGAEWDDPPGTGSQRDREEDREEEPVWIEES